MMGGGVSSAPWLPTDIAGCVLWVPSEYAFTDAGKTTPCGNNDLIYTGDDQSDGNNDATQATESKRLIYLTNQLDGYPAWRGDGVDDGLSCDALAPIFSGSDTPMTVFMIYKIITLESYGRFWGFSNIGVTVYEQFRIGAYSYNLFRHDGVAFVSELGTVQADTNWHYLILNFTGTTLTLRIDGVVDIDDVAFDVGVCTFTTFSFPDLGYPLNMDHAEMAIYNSSLSAGDMTLLETYATTKYPSLP